MLPLVNNVLPPTPAPSPSTAVNPAALTLGARADASDTTRQQLAVAVIATGAPAAYSPKTSNWKGPATGPERSNGKTDGAPSQAKAGSAPSILPDESIWEPPAPPSAQLAQMQQNLLRLPPAMQQATLYSAQALAQNAAKTEEPQQKQEQQEAREQRTRPSKKFGYGQQTGAAAYEMSTQMPYTLQFGPNISKVF